MKNKQSGFTLLETLITLALAAIIATMAIPSLKSFLAKNQLVTQMNQMISVLAYARSEAAKRGFDVSLCIRNDQGMACDNSSSRGYAAGLLVFTDYRDVGVSGSKSNGTYDGTKFYDLGQAAPVQEEILMVTDALPDNMEVVVNSNNFASHLTYTPNGSLSSSIGFSITIRQDGKNRGKITFDLTGRPRSCVLAEDGQNCKTS